MSKPPADAIGGGGEATRVDVHVVDLNHGRTFVNELLPSVLESPGLIGVGTVLLETPSLTGFAVSADGQRFLLSVPVESGTNSPIVVVLNWHRLLQRDGK